MRLERAVLFLGFWSAVACAQGPTATDWHSSVAQGAQTPDAKATSPTPNNLNAVHGRGRPDVPGLNSGEVWAVGDSGTIIYWNGGAGPWVTQSSGVTVSLRAIYIYPLDINVAGTNIAGWACGDGGTLLKLTHAGAVYSWNIANNPSGSCLAGAGGAYHVCADMLAIFPADSSTVLTHVFITGGAMCNPPDPGPYPTFGPNPLLMDLDTSTTVWKVLYPTTAPYTTNPGTGFTHPCAADTAFTGLITDASGPATNPAINGFALDAGTYRNHYNLVGTTWSRGNLVLNSSCGASPPYPAYYGAAKIGPNAIVFGDLDPGSPACAASPAQRIPPYNKVPANVFIYDQFVGGPEMNSLGTGVDITATAWGTIRSVNWLNAWGFGVGVGATIATVGADFSDVAGGLATDAYFALIRMPDPLKVFYQDDPTSPNEILYGERPAAPVTWPNLNGVFLSKYNEGWAVGAVDSATAKGSILHWQGPTVSPAALAVTLTTSPGGALVPNSQVDVVFTVTNTGGTGLVNFNAVLPTPPQLGYVKGPDCSTIFACPTTLAPGASVSFTWTFSVGGCVTGVTFTGSAYGKDVLTTLNLVSSTKLIEGGGIVQVAPTLTMSPPVPVAGANVVYLLVVANTGSATITSLTVVDTIPYPITSPSTNQPLGFAGAATSTVLVAGNVVDRVVWTMSAGAFSAGTSLSFTITGFVPTVCANVPVVANRFIAYAQDSCFSSTVGVSSGTSFAIPGVTPPVVTATMTHAPAAPAPGTLVTFTLTASNTGSPVIDDLVMWETLPAQVDPLSLSFSGPIPFSMVSTAGGILMTWTFTGIGLQAGEATSFSVSGSVYSACQTQLVASACSAWAKNVCPVGPGSVSSTASVPTSFSLPGAMDLQLAVSRQTENGPGNYRLEIVLTVSDTGQGCLTPMTPSAVLTAINGTTGAAAGAELMPSTPFGPAPALTCTEYQIDGVLTSGCSPLPCSRKFTWAYQDTADYPITFTAVVSATICTFSDCASCACGIGGQVSCSASVSVTYFSDAGEPGTIQLNRNLFRPHGLNQKLTVTFNVKENGEVSLRVYNSIGQRVRTLFKKFAVRRQKYPIDWDGTNDVGERVASGVYFVRLESDRFVITKKVALIK